MSEEQESRVWGDQGVEPDPGEEVYEGQTRPIAEYDNWAMYTVTSDISTLFDWLGSVEGDLDDHEVDTSTHGAEEGEHVALTPREDQAVAYDDVVDREHGMEDHDGSVASSANLDSVDDDLQGHKEDTENPHAVDADQVGAPTQSEFDDHRHAGETIVPEKIRLDNEDVEQYIDPDLGALVIEHIPSGNTWTFDPDGSLELEKLSSNTVDASEKNHLPKYDELDDAPDDTGLFVAENEGRLAYKEVN